MPQAMVRAGLLEQLTAIAVAVVGHNPLDRDAMTGKPGERTFEKAGGGFLALVRQDFAVGKSAGVVDADMQTLPADAVMSVGRAVRRQVMRCPMPAIRPSFLVSGCN